MGANDHGKLSTYNNYKCRCVPCRKANADAQAKRRERMSPEQREAENELRRRNRAYRKRNVS